MARHLIYLAAVVCFGGLLAPAGAEPASPGSDDTQFPELAYLKYVNQLRPPSDPELLYILMAQFANAGRHAEGVEYFNGVLRRFEPVLDDTQKAHYLTAIASLRAGQSPEIFLLRRLGWMRENHRIAERGEASDRRRDVPGAVDVGRGARADARILRRTRECARGSFMVPGACRRRAARGLAARGVLPTCRIAP